MAGTRLLWLCKRHYMNKDVLGDRYGRLFELPEHLSKYHVVLARCLSYKRSVDASVFNGESRVDWLGLNSAFGFGVLRWLAVLMRQVKSEKIQVIIASSDIFHIIIGAYLARWCGVPFYADLYDNYESFGMSKVPGMRFLYRRALAGATAIITVSETLQESMQAQYPPVPCYLLESTIDKSLFYERPRLTSRNTLGLPDVTLVGVCGGLNSKHDIETFYRAAKQLRAFRPDLHVVIAGFEGDVTVPKDDNVIFMGALNHSEMPSFFNALDVAVITMSDSDFGFYAFPQKAYEILACNTPIVAADVGALGRLFSGDSSNLYLPGDVDSLSQAIQDQLEVPIVIEKNIPSWQDQAKKLSAIICGG